jgi:hypothetical protein
LLSEFESRLANLLGTRLTGPLAGAVDVAPGVAQSRILVSVRSIAAIDEDLLSVRPEQVPGAAPRRRVLRLKCTVGLEFPLPPGGGRGDEMRALDQAIYLLGDPAFRDGTALLPGDNSDPGFLIRRMALQSAEPPTTALLDAEGLFWPVGVAGDDGPAIVRAEIRAAFLPVRLSPAEPRITAGGAVQDLQFEFGRVGTLRVAANGMTRSPFGAVIVSVVDDGGRQGAGTLAGGAEGPRGSRIVPVANGAASVQYTPPAQAALDHLVVALEDNSGDAGLELARFRLQVRGA